MASPEELPKFDDEDALEDFFGLVNAIGASEADSPAYRRIRAKLDLNLAAATAEMQLRSAKSAAKLASRLVIATYVLAVCTLALVGATLLLALRSH